MPTVMVSCGEASGDLYAGALATELQRLAPGTRVFGLGGPRLAASGAELVGDYRGLAVTGLTEALRVLPRSFGMLRRLRAASADTIVPMFWSPSIFPTSTSASRGARASSGYRWSITSARSCGPGGRVAFAR